MTSTKVGTEGEEDHMARLSTKREQLMEEGREAGRSLIKRENSTGPRTDPCGTPRQLKRDDFCDFDKLRKRAYQKGKIESNERSKKGGQPK